MHQNWKKYPINTSVAPIVKAVIVNVNNKSGFQVIPYSAIVSFVFVKYQKESRASK